MSKQIWLSPVLGTSRERLVTRCSEMIKAGEPPRFLYITASHPLLELVTKWILDFENVRGVWGSLPVYLFRGFVREVLQTAQQVESGTPLARRSSIDVEDSNYKLSLHSQIMRRLVAEGRLTALAPLAHRDGTVNTIATLIGEIQRAGTTPEVFQSIVETRARDLDVAEANEDTASNDHRPPTQIKFDREIGLIYETYAHALDEFGLTEADADQLRAMQVLSGDVSGSRVAVPWLNDLQLLVLDGFFDFTPVQGEILRALIPRVRNVIVNLYGDDQNTEVFRPFADTLDQLRSISDEFEIVRHKETQAIGSMPAALRANLFNPEPVTESFNSNTVDLSKNDAGPVALEALTPRVFRCKDRDTEIRAIAKEIKRLVLKQGFSIRDIALVVRQRASYAETISRVFADEGIPCTAERVINLADVPAARALLKLFRIIAVDGDATNPRVTDLADLIKSGYFRLSEETLVELGKERDGPAGINEVAVERDPDGFDDHSRHEPELFEWDPDELENVFAYVGSELRLDGWIDRARRLAATDTTARDVKQQIFGSEIEEEEEGSEHEEESGREDSIESQRKSAPSREIRPALLQWTVLVLREFAARIHRATSDDELSGVRVGLLRLLEDLQFSNTIRQRLIRPPHESMLAQLSLDFRALSAVRASITAAEESIKIAGGDDASRFSLSLANFVTEVERCIGSQSLRIASADLDGLQVLEATDVRGLRFRAIFIAGLIEGGFPLRKDRDWIYPHDERERLKKYGLTLEDISPATLLKEEHYFYQAACRATDALYLTWPLVVGGSETVASYYIDEVRHALAPIEFPNEDKANDFEGDRLIDVSSHSELATSLVRLDERLRHHGKNSLPVSEDTIERLMSWAETRDIISRSARARITIGRERMGDRFGRYDGLITDKNLLALLAERYGPGYVWSASALSLYGKSPFKFFSERVLKLQSRIEAALDLAAIDAGGLLHEALRRFFAKHRGQRLAQRNRSKLRDEMREIASRVFDEFERTVPPINARVWEIDREIYQLQLAAVVDYEIRLQNRDAADCPLPSYFELGFGMARGISDEKSTSEFLTLERAVSSKNSTETIRLRGQIDRVDLASDGTVLAFDYKSSSGASHDDMIEGRDLQIGIYLEAIERLFFPKQQIAGGGYYVIRSCDRNRGLYRKMFDKYTRINARVSRVEEEEWQEVRATMRRRIWQFVDAIRAGRFMVDPTAPEQTCGICDFASVCRYEKYRILRKGAGTGAGGRSRRQGQEAGATRTNV